MHVEERGTRVDLGQTMAWKIRKRSKNKTEGFLSIWVLHGHHPEACYLTCDGYHKDTFWCRCHGMFAGRGVMSAWTLTPIGKANTGRISQKQCHLSSRLLWANHVCGLTAYKDDLHIRALKCSQMVVAVGERTPTMLIFNTPWCRFFLAAAPVP